MYLKCDLKSFDLSNLGKFDVILIDPPLPEYQRRVEGQLADISHLDPWSFEEIANLRIDLLADQCCFLFLWVGSSEGLDRGRALLKKWNFRRCEDIVWIKTNRHNFNRRFVNDKDTLLVHTKEHCLVGIKGAVKRGVDGHFIHANIDTDVIVSEEPPFGSNEKPQELYRIIERFCLGRKRIELFGEDHNIRPGWLTLGKGLSSSNLDIDAYNTFFEGELCYPEVQGFQGGRYVGCTQEIESLRPRSPSRNNNSIINPLSNNMGMINSSSINNNYSTGNNINSSANSNYYNNVNFGNMNNNYNNPNNNLGNINNIINYGYNNSLHNKSLFNNQNNYANNHTNGFNSIAGGHCIQNSNHMNNNSYSNSHSLSSGNYLNHKNFVNSNTSNLQFNKVSNYFHINNNSHQPFNNSNIQASCHLQSRQNLFHNGNHNLIKQNGNINNLFENSNQNRANPNMDTGIKMSNQFEKKQNNLNFNININNNSNFEDNLNLNSLNNNLNFNQNS